LLSNEPVALIVVVVIVVPNLSVGGVKLEVYLAVFEIRILSQ